MSLALHYITEWEMHITAQGPPSPKWPILGRVGR